MNYKQLQSELKKFRSLGYAIGCKLNAPKAELQAEYDIIIAAQQQSTEEAMEVEMGIEEQIAYQDSPVRDGQPLGYYVNNLEKSKHALRELNTPMSDQRRNCFLLVNQIMDAYNAFLAAPKATVTQHQLRKRVKKLQAKYFKLYGEFKANYQITGNYA